PEHFGFRACRAGTHGHGLTESIDRARTDVAVDDAESSEDKDRKVLLRVTGILGRRSAGCVGTGHCGLRHMRGAHPVIGWAAQYTRSPSALNDKLPVRMHKGNAVTDDW